MSSGDVQPILQAQITTGVGGTFAVRIGEIRASFPEEECFLFTLHYYARVLFELVETQRSVRSLPQWTTAIAESGFDPDLDFFTVAGVEGRLVQRIATPSATATVALMPREGRRRELHGDLSELRGTTLAQSVLAVCQSAVPLLSLPMRAAVPAALANMNASYELNHNYADPASQREVPSLAYLAASFV